MGPISNAFKRIQRHILQRKHPKHLQHAVLLFNTFDPMRKYSSTELHARILLYRYVGGWYLHHYGHSWNNG